MPLQVNTQSSVEAVLQMSQAGLNTRRSASIVLDDKQKRFDAENTKLDIQQKMAAFEEWQSEDAKRYRATMNKLQADSAQFMSENQELINSGWLAEQSANISKNLASWADSENDALSSVLSPLVEAKNFEEASKVYEEVVYPQLQKFLPERQGSFSTPAVFDQNAWTKAKIVSMAATNNRAQRQALGLQENQGLIQQQLNKDRQDHETRLATWDTYTKLLLQDKDWEMKFELARAKGEVATLANIGYDEKKLTDFQNSMVPKVQEEIRAMYPSASDDELLRVSKAVTSDITQEVRRAWDNAAGAGSNPAELFGSPAELASKFLAQRVTPDSGYITSSGIFGGSLTYNPTIAQGKKAAAAKEAEAKAARRQETYGVLKADAEKNPAFQAMSPKAQHRWLMETLRDLEAGVTPQDLPPVRETAPAAPSAAERQTSALTGAARGGLEAAGRPVLDVLGTAATAAFPSLQNTQ